MCQLHSHIFIARSSAVGVDEAEPKGPSVPLASLTLLAGACFHQATLIAGSYPRSWFLLAAWCYRQGRQQLETLVGVDGRFELSEIEVERVSTIMSGANIDGRLETAVNLLLTQFSDMEANDTSHANVPSIPSSKEAMASKLYIEAEFDERFGSTTVSQV